jgi:hypothetical protein
MPKKLAMVAFSSEAVRAGPQATGVASADGTAVTEQSLERENLRYRGSGGVSAESRPLGFQPAFADRETRAIHLSRFADGRPAPCHLLDGLPGELVVSRRPCGRVAAVKASLVSGFVRAGRFYTREEAAAQATPLAGAAR